MLTTQRQRTSEPSELRTSRGGASTVESRASCSVRGLFSLSVQSPCTLAFSRHSSSFAHQTLRHMKASSSSGASPAPRSSSGVEQQAEAMGQLVCAQSTKRNALQPPQEQRPQVRIDYCSPRYGQLVQRPSNQAATAAASSAPSPSSSSASPAAGSSPLVLPLPASCMTLSPSRRAPFQSSFDAELVPQAQALLHSIASSSDVDVGPFANLAEHLHRILLDSLPTLPGVLIDLILQNLQSVSLPFFVSPRCGPHHGDSMPWSSLKLDSTTLLLAGWQLRQIIGWGREYCNGVQLVLGPPHVGPVCKREAEGMSAASALRAAGASVVRAAKSLANTLAGNGSNSGSITSSFDVDLSDCPGFWTSADHHGSHHNPARSVFVLQPDEIVTEVQFNVGSHGDSLRFRTNLARVYRIGNSEGGAPFVFRAPPHSALVGLCGEVGGHLHNLGTIWAPTRKLTQAELEGDLPAMDADESPSPAPAAAPASSSSSFSPFGNFSSSSSRTKGLDE